MNKKWKTTTKSPPRTVVAIDLLLHVVCYLRTRSLTNQVNWHCMHTQLYIYIYIHFCSCTHNCIVYTQHTTTVERLVIASDCCFCMPHGNRYLICFRINVVQVKINNNCSKSRSNSKSNSNSNNNSTQQKQQQHSTLQQLWLLICCAIYCCSSCFGICVALLLLLFIAATCIANLQG